MESWPSHSPESGFHPHFLKNIPPGLCKTTQLVLSVGIYRIKATTLLENKEERSS